MESNNRLETIELLNQLTGMLNDAKTIPLFKLTMLKKEAVADMISRLTGSIPEDMQKAQEIIQQEEDILAESKRTATETTEQATREAETTVTSAKAQAEAMLNEARTQASETINAANEQASATVAEAQAQADTLVADAQARAKQLVSENEIVTRAKTEAKDLLDAAHRESEDYSTRMRSAVDQIVDQAESKLAQELEAIRSLRKSAGDHQQ